MRKLCGIIRALSHLRPGTAQILLRALPYRMLQRCALVKAQNHEGAFADCSIRTCPLELHCYHSREHERSRRGLQLGYKNLLVRP
jgi:hypothetical protein